MSSNLPLICRSCRVLPFLLNWPRGHKLEINIPPQQIFTNSERGGGAIIHLLTPLRSIGSTFGLGSAPFSCTSFGQDPRPRWYHLIG